MIIGIMMGRLTLRTLSDLPVMRKVRLLSLALLISILVPVLFMMESSLYKHLSYNVSSAKENQP
jgi:hypothetical protein